MSNLSEITSKFQIIAMLVIIGLFIYLLKGPAANAADAPQPATL
jgi:hypothetical protein